jgi:hypothetical protein
MLIKLTHAPLHHVHLITIHFSFNLKLFTVNSSIEEVRLN